MQTPSAPDLLNAWERGISHPFPLRSLALLEVACPELPFAVLLTMSIGQRDKLLLELRERLFGLNLASLTTCPACSEQLELEFTTTELLVTPPEPPSKTVSLSAQGYEIHFRLPGSHDLAALTVGANMSTARRQLVERCLVALTTSDHRAAKHPESLEASHLPESLVGVIAARMAEADPQADVQLHLVCPQCMHSWHALFDIAAFIWIEVDSWAQTILEDVHRLACAYSWSESAILALSPWRRQRYLEMIGT